MADPTDDEENTPERPPGDLSGWMECFGGCIANSEIVQDQGTPEKTAGYAASIADCMMVEYEQRRKAYAIPKPSAAAQYEIEPGDANEDGDYEDD